MTLFSLIAPIIISAFISWIGIPRVQRRVFSSAIIALVASLTAYGLLRVKYTLFELGPFMLLPQILGFIMAAISACVISIRSDGVSK